MNILVIGSGGREHAVIKAFSQSQKVNQIYCAPGNAGMLELATPLNLNIQNFSQVVTACLEHKINFVFIGPEDPLVEGLSDELRKNNILVFGPSQKAAQLEGSKIFAKQFMLEAHIPTAHAVIVDSVSQTLSQALNFSAPYVLKADGLAAGKGVFICQDIAQLKLAAEDLFDKKILGSAGQKALLEQNLQGTELSLLVLTNGNQFECLPMAQDHKRLLDNNLGPNTGGMGTIAPLKIDPTLYKKIIADVVEPSIKKLSQDQYLFNGVLFIGLMVVDHQPYVLEYNVRFGDPETQVILPLINNDVAELFYNLSQGLLSPIQFNEKFAFCIVNAAEGYPHSVKKNTPIKLPQNTENTYVLHAGTRFDNEGQLVAVGGRVLNIVAIADNLNSAKEAAYKLNSLVQMSGRQFRNDIGNYF